MLAGAALITLVRLLRDWLDWRRRVTSRRQWLQKADFSVIQACVLSTEHLSSLGRVEKRTLFVKPISEVFRNDYMLARVLEAAEKAAKSDDPVLLTQLSAEDKWHVLNACTNHLSSCFAPYHVFFNEARRAESYYKSAWYCFTLTCAQTSAAGRWFITPHRPVAVDDVGMLRIRVVLMNEQELREIASGAIEPPEFGFFNGRHESRWRGCMRMAELFGRQVRAVTGRTSLDADWGANLCGSISRKRGASHQRLYNTDTLQPTSPKTAQLEPEDNALLRLHIPFPSSAGAPIRDHESRLEECVSKDVVLFE